MHLAYCFYRPLPEQALTGLDLLKFGARGLKKDLAMIGLMGLAIGLLSLAVPESIRILVDEIIPLADRSQLLSLTLGLLAVAIGGGLFQLAQGFALLRVETKADSAIQAAIWDRLLRLPVAFFRRFSAGDLADRANGVSLIRQILTGVTLTTLLAGLFSLLNFFLLFWYSWQLAVVAVGLTVLAVAALSLTSVFQLSYRRRMVERQGKISGLLLQILTAISKFRVTGTESRAFTVWAREFFRQQELTYRAERVENYLTTFNVSYPLATTMVVFTMLVYFNGRSGDSSASLSLGTFLAFSAAFGQFLNAGLNLTATALQISTVVPIYERIKPILQTKPEVDEAKSDPAELSGEIEMSHVSFRYAPDMPLVLDDISFQIKPREFVAFVGPSGAGKSTLIRLLLGFETAESGSIYYDGQDLNMLNIQGVRRQIGTVLQNGELIAGDIFTNIIGSSLLAVKEAWEAAHQAGLAEDIKQMPLGMHTIIGEGGGAFSGGQRQRLLIARSLINRPRIILFDEATSSLDNRTQAIVSQSLERLQATRLVGAHRLSTIINADRIFVLQAGKIVQQGTYQELMEQPVPFAELAVRHLA
jgi:ATP-binding cassette subfamily C protein